MKRVDLIKIEHTVKVGDKCPYIEPNILDDCIFYSNNEPIGFYLTKMSDKMCKLANIANAEFLSNRVTKQGRGGSHTSKIINGVLTKVKHSQSTQVKNSAIIGMIPPQPRFGRNYCKTSSLHDNKSANLYIKSMILLCKEAEDLIKSILPNTYLTQKLLLSDCPNNLKLSELYTSSISNLNVSAPYHQDLANVEQTVNVIICKKFNAKGGDLSIPDYGATIGQQDNSILVYPAWRNIHGVTPITKLSDNGYRNSLVFYPLKSFKLS